MTEYTAAKDALLIYAANVLKEHIRWSPTGPRVTGKIKEMIVAAQSPASALSPSSEPAEPKPSVGGTLPQRLREYRDMQRDDEVFIPRSLVTEAADALDVQPTDTSYMVEQANKLIDQVKERDAEIERLKRDLATMTNNYRARTDASVDIARERNAARAEIERLLASTRRDAHHIRDLTSDLDLCRLEIKSLRHPDG